MKTLSLSSLGFAILASNAFATDRTVDASGAGGSYTTINQAMAVSAPGDRILVLPGTYPAFQFSRGVEVIGMGLLPTDVQVARVDFHPTIPTTGFRCGLSNMQVCGTSADSTSIGGNELAEGVLVIEGVTTCGGVYLHGAGQFCLMVFDSDVQPAAGGGFLNAAFDFGGGQADLVSTRVLGAPASATFGIPAGIGLREQVGAIIRASDSIIHGGPGAELGPAPLWNGGDAVVQGAGPGGSANLRLSGGTQVEGGAAYGGGTGGIGVNLAANATLQLGDASVHGGTGQIQGAPYGAGQPVGLGYDPELALSPARRFALGDTFLRPGYGVQFVLDPALPAPTLRWSISLSTPIGSDGSPLPSSSRIADPSLALFAPPVGGPSNPPPARRRYYQAFFKDPGTGQIVSTNPVAITIDL